MSVKRSYASPALITQFGSYQLVSILPNGNFPIYLVAMINGVNGNFPIYLVAMINGVYPSKLDHSASCTLSILLDTSIGCIKLLRVMYFNDECGL